MEKKTFDYKILIKPLIGIITYIILMIILPEVLPDLSGNMDKTLYAILLNFIIYFIAFIILTLTYKKELVYEFKKENKLSFNDLIVNSFGCYGLILLGSFVGNLITTAFGGGQSENQATIEIILKSQYGIFAILFIAFLGPVCEELVFRKSIIGLCDKFKVSRYLSIALSSLLFGLIHVTGFGDFINMFPYVFMGVGIAIMYNKTDNILVPILGHIINNSISVIIILSGITNNIQ